MLEIAELIKEHIAKSIRNMATKTLKDVRELEFIHDSAMQRAFLTGKLAAYEEIKIFMDIVG